MEGGVWGGAREVAVQKRVRTVHARRGVGGGEARMDPRAEKTCCDDTAKGWGCVGAGGGLSICVIARSYSWTRHWTGFACDPLQIAPRS